MWSWSLAVALTNSSDARLNRITAWLDARPDVGNWRVYEKFDIWYGEFLDINDEIEPGA